LLERASQGDSTRKCRIKLRDDDSAER